MFGQGFNYGFLGKPLCFTDTTDIFKDRSGVALYTLDYDASDSGGATGKYKEGAVFNGSSSQIDTTATLIPNSTDFSLSFWIKPENQFGSVLARGLVTSGSNAWGFVVNFNNSANKLSFFRHTGGAYANEHYAETATNSITIGVWQHVVLSFDKSTGTPQFYIDGSAVTTNIVTYAGGTGSAMATGNIAFNSSYDGGLYRLGNRSNGGLSTSRLKGVLDHFRVFNKVVSASEVATLYSDATDTAQVLGDTSCTAFYNFNNNASDLAGSNNPSSVSNIIYKYDSIPTNVDFGVGGKSLYGARFNGNTSIINTNYVLPADSTMSFSFWAKFDAVDNGSQRDFFGNVAVNGSGSNVNNRLVFRLRNDNNFSINIGNGSNYWSNNTVANATPYYNQWTFLCVTLNGTSVKVYINNSIVSLTSSVAFGTAGVLPLFIGEWGQGFGSKRYKGSIDQFRIFNKELSASEVSKLYGNGAGEIACEYTATTTDIAYPIANAAYYKLDNNSESELATPHYLFLSDAGNQSTSARLNSVDSEFTYARPAGYSEWGGSWDPNNKAGSATQTFEESNKKWTKTGGYYNSVWGTNKYSSGKYYAEIEFLNPDLIYGISRLTTADTYSANLTNNSLAYASYAAYSWIYSSNSNQGFTLSANDVVGFAADFDNKTLQVYKNNVLQKTVSIAAPDGTDINIQYKFGRYGQAALFNGSNSRINLPTGDLGLGTNNFSISLWFNSANITQDNQSLFWFQHYQNPIRIGATVSSSNSGGDKDIRFDCNVSGSGVIINTNSDILESNTWYHAVFVKSSTTGMSIYINGALVASNTSATGAVGTNMTSNGTNSIGVYQTTASSSYFNGKIDQFRMFTTDLSSSQVTELYNEKPEVDTSNFKTVLYNGNSSTNYISNVGFRPDLVWTKPRTNTGWHWVANSIVGGTLPMASNANNSSVTRNDHIQSFDANGFTLGPDGTSNSNGIPTVAWCWKGGGDAVSNTNGTITSQVSANTDAGFSIVKYTGNNTDNATVGHGLGVAPNIVIVKDLTSANYWCVGGSTIGNGENLYLNDPGQKLTRDRVKSVQTNTFTLGNHFETNSTNNFIAYCWYSIAGYSSIGSYEGNGTTKNVNLGFNPSWIMIKNMDAGSTAWNIVDTRRDTDKTLNLFLQANTSIAEANTTICSLITNGFSVTGTNTFNNSNGHTFLYMAFK